MPFGKGHHLHLVDGAAFIFRAFHAEPPRKLADFSSKVVVGLACTHAHARAQHTTHTCAPGFLCLVV